MHPFSESFTLKMYAETGGELQYTMHLNLRAELIQDTCLFIVMIILSHLVLCVMGKSMMTELLLPFIYIYKLQHGNL